MQTTEAKHQEATGARTVRRSRRAWFVGLAILVVAGATTAWVVIGTGQEADIDVAIEFADTYCEALSTGDGAAVAALFTEDGIYDNPYGQVVGPDSIRAHIDSAYGSGWVEARHGDVTEVGDGVFTFSVEGATEGGSFVGEMTITLDGDLVSLAELPATQFVGD